MIIAVAVTVCDTAGAASGFRDTIKVERDYQDRMLYKDLEAESVSNFDYSQPGLCRWHVPPLPFAI